jgi:hypothetical protein
MEHTARTAVTSERVPAVRLLRVGALAAATDVGLLTSHRSFKGNANNSP